VKVVCIHYVNGGNANVVINTFDGTDVFTM